MIAMEFALVSARPCCHSYHLPSLHLRHYQLWDPLDHIHLDIRTLGILARGTSTPWFSCFVQEKKSRPGT